jgi:hypothetical protein
LSSMHLAVFLDKEEQQDLSAMSSYYLFFPPYYTPALCVRVCVHVPLCAWMLFLPTVSLRQQHLHARNTPLSFYFIFVCCYTHFKIQTLVEGGKVETTFFFCILTSSPCLALICEVIIVSSDY